LATPQGFASPWVKGPIQPSVSQRWVFFRLGFFSKFLEIFGVGALFGQGGGLL
jgi:hypothetical protein